MRFLIIFSALLLGSFGNAQTPDQHPDLFTGKIPTLNRKHQIDPEVLSSAAILSGTTFVRKRLFRSPVLSARLEVTPYGRIGKDAQSYTGNYMDIKNFDIRPLTSAELALIESRGFKSLDQRTQRRLFAELAIEENLRLLAGYRQSRDAVKLAQEAKEKSKAEAVERLRKEHCIDALTDDELGFSIEDIEED